MLDEKAYLVPKILRVDLNADQAILSACSLLATDAKKDGTAGCRVLKCKRDKKLAGSDSGPRPS